MNSTFSELLMKTCIIAIVFEPFIYYRIGVLSTTNIVILACTILFSLNKTYVTVLKFVKKFFLFILWSVASLVWSQYSIDTAITRIIDLIVVLALLFICAQYCCINNKIDLYKCEDLISVYIICVVIITIICYAEDGTNLLVWSRLGAKTFANVGGLVAYTLILIPGMFFSLWRLLSGNNTVLYGSVSLFLFISSLLTGERKAMILPFLFIYIYCLFKYRNNAFKIIRVTILCVIIGAFVLMLVMRYSTTMAHRLNILIQTILTPGASSSEIGVSDNSLDIRSSLRKHAIQCFYENPLFGVGIGQFRFYSASQGGADLYAHNNWLELLADVGIIGFLLFYMNYFVAFIKAYRVDNNIGYFISSFMIINLVYEYGQVTYYYHAFGLAFGIVFCIAEGSLVDEHKKISG